VLPPRNEEAKGGADGDTGPRPPSPAAPEGETGVGTKPLPPAPEAPELDEGRGCSTSMEDGATGEGAAALLVEQGTIISKSSSHRKSKEDGGTGA
jgi:hypothetical protein